MELRIMDTRRVSYLLCTDNANFSVCISAVRDMKKDRPYKQSESFRATKAARGSAKRSAELEAYFWGPDRGRCNVNEA